MCEFCQGSCRKVAQRVPVSFSRLGSDVDRSREKAIIPSMSIPIRADQLRSRYLAFFSQKANVVISGKSLVPEHDPTVLFTTAGMHPLVPYLMGEPHPAGTRLVNAQKCLRTGDIDAVGDNSHLTFFEMLGNWSLGDYFKEEAIAFSFEFLTGAPWLGISPDRLSVTVFAGDEAVARDEESAAIWERLGIARTHIHFLPRADNWWGPTGETGPCGPDTEIFFDTGVPHCSVSCRPGCSCGKYVEIWNDVFMQYRKDADGRYRPLERYCVDTGMGIERTVAVLQGKRSVYDTEIFTPLLERIGQLCGKRYGCQGAHDVSMRIVCDHIRAATFILGDPVPVRPSNVGAGYVLRRIIRRSVRHGRKLGIDGEFLSSLARVVIGQYAAVYPELEEKATCIAQELANEERKFLDALRKGEAEYERMIPKFLQGTEREIPGSVAFRLYDTYGFPLELTEELARESGLRVDRAGFDTAFQAHQACSRIGAQRVFKGGLADHSAETTAYHTATHLLHQALRVVLGTHVQQKGSNITAERLRFDFSHPRPMSAQEKVQVEQLVNEQIRADLPVCCEVMSLEDAMNSGAVALFGEKYESTVKVYSIGTFSREVCGGPHVARTGQLGRFSIQKEQSSAAGVRRIRAILEKSGEKS